MIKLTKQIEKATLITHSGTFHPDEVFATVLLSKIYPNGVLLRTNDIPEDYNGDALIYDIGFGKFDHHQKDAKLRDEKIKYCSFGLLWKEFGRQYLKDITEEYEELWQVIDEKLVKQIDAIDNGVFPQVIAPFKLTDLDYIIDLFNPAWNEEKDSDEQFMEAYKIAAKIFERFIIREKARIEANKIIEQLILKQNSEILILPNYMPYQEALFASKLPEAKKIKVIILPSNRGGYSIKPMTISKDSRELLVNFSHSFYGLKDEELVEVSHIKTARFVHSNGFIAACGTLDDAILMAKNAIENVTKI